jgi:hypothetical protein
MDKSKTYESYPGSTILFANLASIVSYASGLIIFLYIGWLSTFIYLALIIAMEYRLLSSHCVNCYYFGKACGFGKGKLSALFFRKGDPAKFCEKDINWKDMLPELVVSLLPIAAAVVLLIIEFNTILLILVLLIILISTAGNSFIRGRLTCRYCKQREIGCPAQKLFQGHQQTN